MPRPVKNLVGQIFGRLTVITSPFWKLRRSGLRGKNGCLVFEAIPA